MKNEAKRRGIKVKNRDKSESLIYYGEFRIFLGFETSKSKKKKCQTPELDVIEEIGESRHEFLMSSSRNIH